MWKFLLCSKKMGRTITEQPSSQSRVCHARTITVWATRVMRRPNKHSGPLAVTCASAYLQRIQSAFFWKTKFCRNTGKYFVFCILEQEELRILGFIILSDSFCALSVDYYSGVCQQNFLPRLTFVILGYPVLWCQSREQKLFVFVPIWSSSAFYIWNALGQWTHDCSMNLIWKYTFTFWYFLQALVCWDGFKSGLERDADLRFFCGE